MRISAAAAVIALSLSAACGHSPNAGEPPKLVGAEAAEFDALIDDITLELLRTFPEWPTQLGLDEEAAGGRFLDRLSDYGPAGREQMRGLVADIRSRLAGVDPAPLDDARRLTLSVLMTQLEAGVAADAAAGGWGAPDFGYFTVYPVSQFDGLHLSLPEMMTVAQPVGSSEQASLYVTRLSLFGEAFDGAIELMEADHALGVTPPDFVIDKTLDQIANFTRPPPEENPLYTTFAEKLTAAEAPDPQVHLAAAETAIRDVVYPAYGRLAAALERIRPSASHDASLSSQPNGVAVYEAMIRLNADYALSAEEVHALGLAEVDRITAEMDAILASQGRVEGPVAERMQALNADPSFVLPNTEESKAELLALAQAELDEISALMPDWFGTLPAHPVVVRRFPSYAEEAGAPGYYDTPALDGSRPGIFWLNLRDTAIQPTWVIKTVAYHEAIPGHHIQLSLALSQGELPLLRQTFGSTTAFSEGWALYAERLAWEMGLYEDDPYGDLGRLRWEMHRAVRLVVDSGMHAKGWSREQAIDYMVEVGGIDPNTAEQEIERYAAIPGQALGYKVGMLKILELRSRAQEALGDAFDIRAFHDAVLLDAGLPLPVLEERIDAWIAAGGKR